MPATTVMPVSAAARRTPSAHGPSRGSATGCSETPNRHIVASGNTTSRAPSAAARRVYSSTVVRLAAGSVPLSICARAIRMRFRVGRAAVTGSDAVPRHREHRVTQPASLRCDGDAGTVQLGHHLPPAHPRPEHALTRRGGPGAVGRGQQRVDRLARNIVVDKHFRQPLSQIGRSLEMVGVARQCQADRAIAVKQHPAAPSAQLVTRAVDHQSAGGQPGPQCRPGVRHLLDRVLAQHVERAHQHRPQPGQLETAEGELHPGRRRRLCGVDPHRVDLQADHPHVCPHVAAAGRPVPASSPAARRNPGRPPGGLPLTPAEPAPAANEPASGRSGAAGCTRWYPA